MSARLAGVLAGATLALAGCGATTPASVTTTYPPLPEPLPPVPSSTATFTGACAATELAIPAAVPADFTHLTDYLDAIRISDLDSTGSYAVGQTQDVGTFLVLWDHGVPTAVRVDTWVEASSVNAFGMAVGTLRWDIGVEPDGRTIVREDAFLYAHGELRTLAIPDGYSSARARGINDRGDVAGLAWQPGGAGVAVVWDYATGHAPRILPAAGNAEAAAIADDGTVVGTVAVPGAIAPNWARDSFGLPYVWAPDGTGRQLPLPEGREVGEVYRLRGDWAMGQAYHQTQPPDPAYDAVPVRWNVHAGSVTTHAFGDYPTVNAHGDVAGVPTGDRRDGAVLTRDGQAYPLPYLDRNAPAVPVAVSDDGTVVVGDYGLWDHPTGVGLLWSCGK